MKHVAAIAGIVGLASLGSAALAQAPAELFPLPLHTTGRGATDFVVLDADHDGMLDIVATGWEWTGGRLFTLRGEGGATFGLPTAKWLDAIPYDVTAADLDHDGLTDLIAVAFTRNHSGCLLISRGRASGGFWSAMRIDLDVQPTHVLAEDIDEDGHLDLLVNDAPGSQPHSARLLRGRGDATFGPPLDVDIDEQLRSPRLVDLDLDGHLDLAAIVFVSAPPPTGGWRLHTYAGNGHGRFTPRSVTPLERASSELAYFDFDGDGRGDSIVSAEADSYPVVTAGSVNVLPTQADGSPGAPITLWSGGTPGRVDVADIDGDGRVDVVVPYRAGPSSTGGIAVARGLGGFAFAPPNETRIGTPLAACEAADLDGDGDMDIAALSLDTTGSIAVIRAIAPGVFDTGPPTSPLAHAAGDIATGDLDGDGLADLVTVGGTNQVERQRGLGDGRFTSELPLMAATRLEGVVLHDFNSDGRADVAVVGPWNSLSPGTLSVWRSTAAGYAARDDYAIGSGSHSVAHGDLDGDGRADLAVSSYGEVQIFHARQDGTFEEIANLVIPDVYDGPRQLIAGDFDGDGRVDLAAKGVEVLTLAYGLGGGAFALSAAMPVTTAANLLGAGDLDLDGREDLVFHDFFDTVSQLNTAHFALFSRANGTFERVRLTDAYNAACALIEDFSGDGLPDVLLLNSSELVVLAGDGQGGFEPQRAYCSGSVGRGAAADFNGDGRVDIAATLWGESAFSVFLRR